MRKYTVLLIITLISIATVLAQEGLYETNPDGEVINGEIPSDFEGKINGQVILPDGVLFDGSGIFKGGELIIESGIIKSLSIINALYTQAGSLIVVDGSVNNIPVKNGFKIESTLKGFTGFATEEVPTIINNVLIKPAGTKFEYPSSSGKGIIVEASAFNLQSLPEGGHKSIPSSSRIEVNGNIIEIEAGKSIEIEPDGTVKTTTAKISHRAHSGHPDADVHINPRGSDTILGFTIETHSLLTKKGEISLTDNFGRTLGFKGIGMFAENSLNLGKKNLLAEGGWDFTFIGKDYDGGGTTGLFFENNIFPGKIKLGLGETLSIGGENILAETQIYGDKAILSGYTIGNGIGDRIHYVSPFSRLFSDSIGYNNFIHFQEMAQTTFTDSSALEVASTDFSKFIGQDEHDDHSEGLTTTTLNGDETHTLGTHVDDGHGQFSIFGASDSTGSFRVFLGEVEHEDPRKPLDLEKLYQHNPSLEFGIGGIIEDVGGGSISYNLFDREIGASVEYGSLEVFAKIPFGAEIGGHHGSSFEGNSKFGLNYKLECGDSLCIKFNVFIERSLSGDYGPVVSSIHPDSNEYEEHHGHED